MLVKRLRPYLSVVALLTSSSGFIILAGFLRGVILARALGPDQYGLAVLIITVAAGLDILTDGGIDQYVVRGRFSHRGDVLAATQSWRLTSTVVGALLLLLLALPLATALSTPVLAPAFALIAGPVVLRGLGNLSIKLEQRERRYSREVRIDIARNIAELAVLVAALWLWDSYWAVVAGLYANALTALLVSHWLAPRAVRYSGDARRLRLIGRFSVPIMVNALILFAASQGDRLIISSALAPRDVAYYAVACALGQAAVALISRVTNSMVLPMFGAGQHRQPDRQARADQLFRAYIGGALVVGVGLCLAGPTFVRLAYGPAFVGLAPLIFASAGVQVIQLQQALLSSLMVSAGATRRFPLITGTRAMMLPLALPLLMQSGKLLMIPAAMAVGATGSLLWSLREVRRLGLVTRTSMVAALLSCLLMVGLLVGLALGVGK